MLFKIIKELEKTENINRTIYAMPLLWPYLPHPLFSWLKHSRKRRNRSNFKEERKTIENPIKRKKSKGNVNYALNGHLLLKQCIENETQKNK